MTIHAPDHEARPAAGHANYSGDVTAGIAADITRGTPKGPNYLGEYMWPVTAAYDADSDRTRVGFTLIPPTTQVATR